MVKVGVGAYIYGSYRKIKTVRAGLSFQLGTLSTRIANLLCMTLVNVVE